MSNSAITISWPYFLLLVALYGLPACALPLAATTDPDSKREIPNAEPQLLFLSFSAIKKPVEGGMEIQLLDKIIAAGRLKDDRQTIDSLEPGILYFRALDINKQPVYSLCLSNPLFKTVEYINDAGELAVKEVEVNYAEFFVRIPFRANIYWVAIDLVQAPKTSDIRLFLTKIADR